jgi:hypothetical protein
MVSEQRVTRGRHERREAGEELQRRHHARLGAPVAKYLDAIREAPTGESSQPVEREWGPRSVAHQALAPEIVIRRDGDAGVEVESVALDGPLAGRWRVHVAAVVV